MKFGISLPVLETVGTADNGIPPPPTIAYVMKANLEFLLPERSTKQNRQDILAYAKNLLAAAVVTSVVQDLETVW
jgi:hypothetical protein